MTRTTDPPSTCLRCRAPSFCSLLPCCPRLAFSTPYLHALTCWTHWFHTDLLVFYAPCADSRCSVRCSILHPPSPASPCTHSLLPHSPCASTFSVVLLATDFTVLLVLPIAILPLPAHTPYAHIGSLLLPDHHYVLHVLTSCIVAPAAAVTCTPCGIMCPMVTMYPVVSWSHGSRSIYPFDSTSPTLCLRSPVCTARLRGEQPCPTRHQHRHCCLGRRCHLHMGTQNVRK